MRRTTQSKPSSSSSMVVEPPSSVGITANDASRPSRPFRGVHTSKKNAQITSVEDLMSRMNMVTSSSAVAAALPTKQPQQHPVRHEKVRDADANAASTTEDEDRHDNNTITHAAAMAGVWALERMIDDQDDDGDDAEQEADDGGGRAKGKLTSVVMPKEQGELIKILHEFVGPELLESRYVPDFVRRDVTEKTGWAVATFRFVHEGVGVDLCVVSTYEDMMVNRAHHDMLRTLMFGIDCVSKLTSGEQHYSMPDAIAVTCLLTEHDREMPDERATPLDVENVNAGVTLLPGGGDITTQRRVLVYRRQHARKVLLHELVHCMGLDAPLRAPGMEDAMEHAEQAVATRLNYSSSSGEFLSGEAYCEVLACYWHMYLHVPDMLREGAGATADAVQAVKQLWRRERSHYLQVCALILLHFLVEEETYDDDVASERNNDIDKEDYDGNDDDDDVFLKSNGNSGVDTSTTTYATTLKDKMDAAIRNANKLLRRRSRQKTSSTTDKGGRDMKNKEEAKVAMRAVRSAEMEERTHVLSYFFAKAALWDRLGQLPATVLEEDDARRFWELYQKALTSTRFWTDVARSRAASALSMTSLDDYERN